MSASHISAPGYGALIHKTVPLIIANCATPLLGLADTAVIGHFASATDLAAVALGALLFSFIFWGLGFLRMSTTGFVAGALGRNTPDETPNITLRAFSIAAFLSLVILALQIPIMSLAGTLLSATQEVELVTASYFHVRIWGAPATLITYVLLGYLIGSGANKALLLIQISLNSLNIILDLIFAGIFKLGAPGIALGTVLAEWTIAIGSLYWLFQIHWKNELQFELRQVHWPALMQGSQFISTLKNNGNIMVRTLFLLFGFALFIDQSAQLGTITVAANHLLLQFISFSAFFLDGFAYTTESLVGRAIGAKQLALFDLSIKRTSVLAATTGLVLAAIVYGAGDHFIHWITSITDIRQTAKEYLGYASLYILCSFAAFQLDGIFIGASASKALRNASILSCLGFVIICLCLRENWSNDLLWWSFIGFINLRALFLLLYLPKLRRSI